MRIPIKLDLGYAQECIRQAEPVSHHISELTSHVASLYNEKFGTKYSPGLFYLRIKQKELTANVPKGIKGRVKGVILSAEQKEKMRAGKATGKKIRTVDLLALKKMHPDYELLCEKAAAGSKVAAIKLKCLNCTCFVPKEITLCTSEDCALHQFRPYQKNNGIASVRCSL